MSRNPIVAFGLLASTMALKAKQSSCTTRDRLGFAMAALEWLPAQDAAQKAVVAFDAMLNENPLRAGCELQLFVDNWLDEVSPRKLEETLDAVQAEGVYAWQQRADLQ